MPAIKHLRLWFGLCAGVVGAASCGYHLAARGDLPQGIRSLRFASFQNKSSDPGIEKEVELALKSALRERGRWNVVDGSDPAEAVVFGTVASFESRPRTFSGQDLAVEYVTAISLDLSLVREADGKVLWSRKGIYQDQVYGIVPQTIITSSSQFRRETLNAKDLPSFSEISLAETQRRAARSRLLDRLAREVYQQLTSGF